MNNNIDPNKGFTGLANLGNTCFLNSCVQALSHTHELTHFLSSEKYKKHINESLPENIIIQEWNDLHKTMWSQNGVVSPKRFVHHIQQLAGMKNRELFTGWAQNDLPEFLLFIIECMHNSISRPVKMNITGKTKGQLDKLAVSCYSMLKEIYSKEYSEFMEMFYGIYVSELSSKKGNIIHSLRPESYFILDLELPKHNPTLYDCFDSFTQYEYLEGDNSWYNEKTKQKEEVKKRITFWSLPKVLIITLKRFSFDGAKKRQDLVQFPLNDLDLSKYVTGYNSKQYKYDLYAICNHSGGPMGGHYTSYIKTIQGEWIHYNDTNVTRNMNKSKLVTPKAYCLFYRKQ